MSTKTTSSRVWARGNDSTCTLLGFMTQFPFSAMVCNAMFSYYYLLMVRFCTERIRRKVDLHSFGGPRCLDGSWHWFVCGIWTSVGLLDGGLTDGWLWHVQTIGVRCWQLKTKFVARLALYYCSCLMTTRRRSGTEAVRTRRLHTQNKVFAWRSDSTS